MQPQVAGSGRLERRLCLLRAVEVILQDIPATFSEHTARRRAAGVDLAGLPGGYWTP